MVEIIRTLNKKWDELSRTIQVSAVGIFILFGLLVMHKILLAILVILLFGQRIVYFHDGFLKVSTFFKNLFKLDEN